VSINSWSKEHEVEEEKKGRLLDIRICEVVAGVLREKKEGGGREVRKREKKEGERAQHRSSFSTPFFAHTDRKPDI